MKGTQKGRDRRGQKNTAIPHRVYIFLTWEITFRIPLNDDVGEKVARMQSRQALHDLQMNQIKAAVKTPMPPVRKLNSYERASSSSPRTPRGSENGPDGELGVMSGRAVTPMKRVPILANFEEWMKMATDNKINATNSWNFALIDYFHDMSLLREGDGVNFQKASCTLDGCVKIYTSRVDSVATETGKLLSGLADSGSKRRRENGGEGVEGEGEEDEEDEIGENGVKKLRKKVTNLCSLFGVPYAPRMKGC
jgi:condensin complex subunit 2